MVVAIEPDPLAYRLLQRNTSNLDNTRAYRVAISDAEGVAFLQRKYLLDAGANILAAESRIPVKAITLDRLVESLDRDVDAVIIDAEGAELSVVMGGPRTWGSVKWLSIEIHHYARAKIEEKVEELLSGYGLIRVRRVIECKSPLITVGIYSRAWKRAEV